MSEMLANHYFLVEKYSEAERLYEDLVSRANPNLVVSKKLILCYLYNREIQKALNLFSNLVKDKDLFLSLINESEDCPCGNVLKELETKRNSNLRIQDFYLILGMAYGFKDIQSSISYFKQYLAVEPNNVKVKKIIQSLKGIIH